MRAATTPSDALRQALADPTGAAAPFVHALREHLQDAPGEGVPLADRLVAFAGPDEARRAALTDALGLAARRLADCDAPPTTAPEAQAWRALVEVAHRLHGSGFAALGRLPFLSDALLRALADEARCAAPADAGRRRATAPAGDALAALAVSRQLRDAVSAALGEPVRSVHRALYEYDPPGSHVRTHVDSRDFPVVVHLLLEHAAQDGAPRASTLVVHAPAAAAPSRVAVRPGDATALRGRGTLHSWAPLGGAERRTMAAIGFEPLG